MSVIKVGSLEIKHKVEVVKTKTVEATLPEDERILLDKAKIEMEANIRHYKERILSEIGFLSPQQLHEMKVTPSVNYQNVLKQEKAKRLQYQDLMDAFSKKLHSKIKRKFKNNSWYLLDKPKYEKIVKTIKNEYPFYIEVENDGYTIKANFGNFYVPDSACEEKFLVSPLEQYITRFKNGEAVEIIELNGSYLLYGNNIYKASRSYTNEQLRLLIFDNEDKERRKFERLKNKFDLSEEETKKRREKIPENVRIAVWRRDDGKCVKCSSRENLEYDHIVPFSKGGSNTARNIELLCEKCNREKSDKIM